MAFSFRKNMAAAGDYFGSQVKIARLKGQIKAKQMMVAKIRGEDQALKRVERGGPVGGKSMPAAGGLARKQGQFR